MTYNIGMKYLPLLEGDYTKVDDDVYEWAKEFDWYTNEGGYVIRFDLDSGKIIHLHRQIIDAKLRDHINGNKLDNTYANLRPATNSGNSKNRGIGKNNTSGYKGVTAKRGKWLVYIQSDGEKYAIGLFTNREEAAYIYDQWALQLHGEFARTNVLL